MKNLVVIVVFAGVVAAVAAQGSIVRIRYYDNDYYGPGNYRFAFAQTDGTRHEQRGEIRNQGLQNEHLAVNGEYAWQAPNGRQYIVKYKADDKGYNADVEEGPGTPLEITNALIG